jgi:hypothetical protein
MRSLRVALVLALTVLVGGCVTSLGVAGGPMFAVAGNGDDGAQLQGHVAFGGAHVGAGGAVRVKSSETLSQLAASAEGYARAWGGTFVPFVRAGVHLVQLEWFRGLFEVSALSPYGELGVVALLHEGPGARPGLSLALTAEHDLRFERDDATFLGVVLGAGFFSAGE